MTSTSSPCRFLKITSHNSEDASLLSATTVISWIGSLTTHSSSTEMAIFKIFREVIALKAIAKKILIASVTVEDRNYTIENYGVDLYSYAYFFA